MIVGIEPKEELSIKTWWQVREGEYLWSANEALVGTISAELLKLNIGDQVSLNGSNTTVIGILDESGSSDDYQIFVPSDTLQTTRIRDKCGKRPTKPKAHNGYMNVAHNGQLTASGATRKH